MVKEKALYKHFKGTTYYVHCVSQHTETNELFVNYQRVESVDELIVTELVGIVWTRPLENFCSSVEVNGEILQRFTLLDQNPLRSGGKV